METKNKGGRPKVVKPKEHLCSHCDYKTKSTACLKKHYLDIHATEKERLNGYKYYCSYCKVGFMGISTFNRHNMSKRHQRLSQLE